jgi:hypothetical protein
MPFYPAYYLLLGVEILREDWSICIVCWDSHVHVPWSVIAAGVSLPTSGSRPVGTCMGARWDTVTLPFSSVVMMIFL